MRIEPIAVLAPAELEGLLVASQLEGIRNVARLVADYQSGANRFSQPGEVLLAARDDVGAVLGVGGLNRISDAVGLLRRFYVLPEARGRGIGTALLLEVLRRNSFSRLELRAMTPAAARFYERQGFRPVIAADFTHELEVA